MNIEVFAISYNEEVMIPFFMRHYSRFASKITIFDNESTDDTVKLARGMGAQVLSWSSNNQIRDDLYLQIKNNCWKWSLADWVIVCDIDELVFNIHPEIDILSDPAITIIQPDWYEMVGDFDFIGRRNDPVSGLNIEYLIDTGINLGQNSKSIMFRPSVLKEINYDPGCHECYPIGAVAKLRTSYLAILHYKFLSPDYVVARHKMFGERLSDINKKYKWGVQYEYSEEKIRADWQELWDKKVKLI